jgi:hypothetical protein
VGQRLRGCAAVYVRPLSDRWRNSIFRLAGDAGLSGSATATALTYNDAGQQTGASNAGGNGPETLTYAGAGQNQVLSEGPASDYVIRDQQGDPLGYVSSGTTYAYATDDQGSVTGVIASCGCDVAACAYDPTATRPALPAPAP